MVVRCVITPGYHLQNNDYFIMKSLVLFSFCGYILLASYYRGGGCRAFLLRPGPTVLTFQHTPRVESENRIKQK
ncbi:MAG: hypothetical protein CMIDDMOC_00519 [Sodalis sp. Fle]|nr:MAG: hypothetical protein CMIDDMOC_00519 [Sodalis sp. Fle]